MTVDGAGRAVVSGKVEGPGDAFTWYAELFSWACSKLLASTAETYPRSWRRLAWSLPRISPFISPRPSKSPQLVPTKPSSGRGKTADKKARLHGTNRFFGETRHGALPDQFDQSDPRGASPLPTSAVVPVSYFRIYNNINAKGRRLPDAANDFC